VAWLARDYVLLSSKINRNPTDRAIASSVLSAQSA